MRRRALTSLALVQRRLAGGRRHHDPDRDEAQRQQPDPSGPGAEGQGPPPVVWRSFVGTLRLTLILPASPAVPIPEVGLLESEGLRRHGHPQQDRAGGQDGESFAPCGASFVGADGPSPLPRRSSQINLVVKGEHITGRLVCFEFPSLYLLGTYAPNASSGLKNMQGKIDWNDAFEAKLRCVPAPAVSPPHATGADPSPRSSSPAGSSTRSSPSFGAATSMSSRTRATSLAQRPTGTRAPAGPSRVRLASSRFRSRSHALSQTTGADLPSRHAGRGRGLHAPAQPAGRLGPQAARRRLARAQGARPRRVLVPCVPRPVPPLASDPLPPVRMLTHYRRSLVRVRLKARAPARARRRLAARHVCRLGAPHAARPGVRDPVRPSPDPCPLARACACCPWSLTETPFFPCRPLQARDLRAVGPRARCARAERRPLDEAVRASPILSSLLSS